MAEGELVQKIVPEAAFIEDVAAFVKGRLLLRFLFYIHALTQKNQLTSTSLPSCV